MFPDNIFLSEAAGGEMVKSPNTQIIPGQYEIWQGMFDRNSSGGLGENNLYKSLSFLFFYYSK